ncbi:MAG: hypothetical protein CML06_21070 [Pseudomonadales bacterium]|nr:hypothetical protein [Pseudomonadales bacterium]
MQDAILLALRSDEPLENEMKRELRFAFEELCCGHSPQLFISQPRGGKKRLIQQLCIQDAVNFIEGAKCICGRAGGIESKKLVAQYYGVNVRTVDNWIKQYSANLNSILPKNYRKIMEISAARYQLEKSKSKYAKEKAKNEKYPP